MPSQPIKSPTGARSTASRPATTQDALAKLKADHDAVRKLFDQFDKNKSALSPDDKTVLVDKICGELIVHAQIEEEIFYPAVRAAGDDELGDLLDEAEVEHNGAKELIAQLEDETPEDALYDAKVTVLGEYIKHHAGEEETQMFPRVRKLKEVDLDELGRHLCERADVLKQELGIV